MADERGPQARRGWPICLRCEKPIIPNGLGTALKPALEPICLARKPLVGTVAANVLAHGTGALNIDGCRIEAEPRAQFEYFETGSKRGYDGGIKGGAKVGTKLEGRWPANLIHDGSDEVLSGFPDTSSGLLKAHHTRSKAKKQNVYGEWADGPGSTFEGAPSFGDSGSAARFFYSAKATKLDRMGSDHPTVKPVELMRWLVRLITPPGGTVLDPFAGSGSTGIAAFCEGFDAELIELREEAAADAQRRLDFIRGLGRVKALEMARLDEEKARKAAGHGLPLFGP